MNLTNLTNWISMDETPPKLDQRIRYYFEHTGVSIGIYGGKDEEYGWHCVYGKDGFLGEDGMFWQPITDEEFEIENGKIPSLKDLLSQ